MLKLYEMKRNFEIVKHQCLAIKKTCFNFTLKYKEEGRGGGNGVKNQQNREGNRDCVRYFQHA